ncbi:MAG: DNA-binding protein [Acidobacteriia bacterium]|nr:DNA-binding protein [Terriglobia bacterium]
MISAKSLLLGGLLLLAVAPGAGGASGPLSAKSVPAQKAADVPDAYTVSGHFTRIVVARMKNQVDMLVGLRAALAREKIRNAVILSGAGSLVSYHVHVVSNTTLPATEAFFKGEGPFDLVTANGYIIEGRVHCHITFSNPEKSLGGHLEPGTRVFTFAIITLGVLDDATSLKRFDDSSWR